MILNQDKYISKVNSFEVDYKFLVSDYITACIDEQGVNFILNYYNNYSDESSWISAEKYLLPYLKSLKPINNTSWGDSITEKDYKDWAWRFWLNDSRLAKKNNSKSILENYVNKKPDFKSIDIRSQRSGTGDADLTWEI
ncbi:hypothetical protein [Spiroplasma endosymbiont of Nomada ruficornis]|uniref:hypothetical protein n=1 Tax=Spiroplasma endosymbiont of Nomada ruficornis TaxID=3066325 RepID=UPI00313C9821